MQSQIASAQTKNAFYKSLLTEKESKTRKTSRQSMRVILNGEHAIKSVFDG